MLFNTCMNNASHTAVRNLPILMIFGSAAKFSAPSVEAKLLQMVPNQSLGGRFCGSIK